MHQFQIVVTFHYVQHASALHYTCCPIRIVASCTAKWQVYNDTTLLGRALDDPEDALSLWNVQNEITFCCW